MLDGPKANSAVSVSRAVIKAERESNGAQKGSVESEKRGSAYSCYRWYNGFRLSADGGRAGDRKLRAESGRVRPPNRDASGGSLCQFASFLRGESGPERPASEVRGACRR